MKKLFVILIISLISVAVYAQKSTLALNLTKGTTYYMATNSNMAISQTINSELQNVNSAITAKMAFTVTGIIDTTYTMEVKYVRIGMHMSTASGIMMDFESDKGDSKDIFSTIMANMTNRPFSIVMSKTGKLLAISHTENLSKGLFDNVTGLTDEQQAQFREQLMKSFGPKAFKGNIEIGTAVFPDVKVAKNDT